mgnify:CR=1 FL=1
MLDDEIGRCPRCSQPMTAAASIERGHCWRCHYTPAPASPTQSQQGMSLFGPTLAAIA